MISHTNPARPAASAAAAQQAIEQLTVDTVPEFLQQRPQLAGPVDPHTIVSVSEVGDGNLNLVFIVRDGAGNGVVVKQSLPHVRTDPSWSMTRDRTRREAGVLAAHQAVDPAHVPALYGFDEGRIALTIEDLSDHALWRNELNAGRIHPYAARELGLHIGAVGFATSAFGTPGPELRRRIAESANPELSEITEDLVFTEPYIDHEHNSWLPENAADVAELRSDRVFVREIGLAKLRFQQLAQSLVHGDLHTGSVFVRVDGGGDTGSAAASSAGAGSSGSVRAFDSEFGTYAPTGFDLGAVWGNLLIAAARARVQGRDADAELLLSLPVDLLDAFTEEYRRRWPDRVDPRVYGDDVLETTIGSIQSDAAIYAAAKAARRMYGFARVADIETLPETERAEAVRLVLRAARRLGTERLEDASVDRLVAGSRAVLFG